MRTDKISRPVIGQLLVNSHSHWLILTLSQFLVVAALFKGKDSLKKIYKVSLSNSGSHKNVKLVTLYFTKLWREKALCDLQLVTVLY